MSFHSQRRRQVGARLPSPVLSEVLSATEEDKTCLSFLTQLSLEMLHELLRMNLKNNYVWVY